MLIIIFLRMFHLCGDFIITGDGLQRKPNAWHSWLLRQYTTDMIKFCPHLYFLKLNNLILIVTYHLIGWKNQIILYNLCCLCHNKADIKNVSIRTKLHLSFVHFKVISNVNSSYLLYILAENQIIKNEFNSYPSYTHKHGLEQNESCPNPCYTHITWVAIEFIP